MPWLGDCACGSKKKKIINTHTDRWMDEGAKEREREYSVYGGEKGILLFEDENWETVGLRTYALRVAASGDMRFE